jgi:predicted RNase H-like HicB family nuclease
VLNSEELSEIKITGQSGKEIKSLPRILEEMEDNIRAAAEAALRAEKAARAATHASEEAEKRLDEVRRVGEETARKAISAAETAAEKAEKATKTAVESTSRFVGNNIVGKYLVVFEKTDNNYSAYLPDIPGCVATGKTRAEAEKNIRGAIDFHIEGLKEDGLSLPEPAASIEYIEV